LFLQRIEGLYENAEKLELFKHMTLSQIIAKDSHYDKRIPVTGFYEVFVKIQNGNVVNVKVTEDIREKDK